MLADRYRVIALDQRGHGDSDWADVYGTVPMVADVIGVLDALAIERVALVGHSMGGLVGTCAVALHPERFTRLVLGDIGPEPGPRVWHASGRAWPSVTCSRASTTRSPRSRR